MSGKKHNSEPKPLAAKSSDWTAAEWRKAEQTERARMAPAGMTSNVLPNKQTYPADAYVCLLLAALLLPAESLSLNPPPFSLPSHLADNNLRLSEDSWAAIKSALVSANAVDYLNSISSSSQAYSIPTIRSENTQRALDIYASVVPAYRNEKNPPAKNSQNAVDPKAFLNYMDTSVLKPLEQQMRTLIVDGSPSQPQLEQSPEISNQLPSPSTSTTSAIAKLSTKSTKKQIPKPLSALAPPSPSPRSHSAPAIIPITISSPPPPPPAQTPLPQIVADTINQQAAVVSKCGKAIQAILHNMDAYTSSELSNAAIVSSKTGMPTVVAIEAVTRPLRWLADSKRGGLALWEWFMRENDGGEGDEARTAWNGEEEWVRRLLKVCEGCLGACERVAPVFVVTKNSGSSSSDDAKNKHEAVVVDDKFDEFYETSVVAMEASVLALLIVNQSDAKSGTTRSRTYGEETLVSLISTIKSRLNEIFAAIKLFSDDSNDNFKSQEFEGLLRNLLDDSDTKKKFAKIVTKLCDSFKILVDVLGSQTFSDSLVISTYVMCVPSFFQESNSFGAYIGIEKIQLSCIQVMSAIFAQALSHRMQILEEIAGYLLKLQSVKKGLRQYKLRSGKAVQMVSALVLQLLQSTFCNLDVAEISKKVHDTLIQAKEASDESVVPEGVTQNNEKRCLEMILSTAKHGFESAHGCALFFLKYMISRSFSDGSSRLSVSGRKSLVASAESELRAIFENLVEDFLTLLGEPEWPAADFVTLIFCKLMTQCLEDKKANTGDAAIKSFALDFLGQLTSRLFSSQNNAATLMPKLDGLQKAENVLSLRQMAIAINGPITNTTSGEKISQLWEMQSILIDWLKDGRENDSSFDGARTFQVFSWIHSLSGLFTSANVKVDGKTLPANNIAQNLLLQYCDAINGAKSGSDGKFLQITNRALPPAVTSQIDPVSLVKIASWVLFSRSPLQTIRETLLHHILLCLDSDIITIRTRALKALSDVVSVDAKVLSLSSVKRVIANRLLDPSKMVRDAAVELVGGYLMKEFNIELIQEYYPLLIPRILDVGPVVRKRVIKLIKEIAINFSIKEATDSVAMDSTMLDRLVEIVCKIMGRVSDEETSIKDLALKSIAEILFSPYKHSSNPSSATTSAKACESVTSILLDSGSRASVFTEQPIKAKFEIKCRATLIMKTVEVLATSASLVASSAAAESFGDIIKMLLEGPSSIARRRDVVTVSRSLVECLVEMILVFEDLGDKDSVKNAFVLLNQFARVIPEFLLPHVKMLHAYLRSSTTPNQQQASVTEDDKNARLNEERITAAVVSILGLVIPHSVDPDLNLMAAIEGDLLILLSRRSLTVVNLIVPCLTNIVHSVTHNYAKLTKVLRTCLENFEKCKQMITSAKTGAANFLNAANTRAIARGLIIVSLLVRNFDFDKFRSLLKDQAATDVEPFPNILASVCAFVSLFAGPLASPELKSIALQALGNLFISHPRMMIKTESQVLMNGIFKNGLLAHKIELIKIFVEFLKMEQLRMMNEEIAKKAAISSEPNKTVDIKVLIGNADEMADAGVSSAVMQMYLSYILEGLMSVDKTLNTTAFDAICIIIEQGLAHPLLCVPYVVAMQTSPVPSVRDRAVLVYDNLAEKHQTFIHSRTGECVRKAFEYRMSLAQAVTATLPANVAPALVWADGYHIHAKVVSVSDDGAAYQRGGVVAFLENMYAKIQVKRQRRNEFLTTLVRSFDVDFSSTNEDKNVIPFARFTAETLAALNYKSVDEVMIIIHHIYQILSVSGETILKFIEDLKAGLYENDEELLKLNAKASVLMGILVMLKSFFLKLYGLSDSKCRLFAPADASSRNTEKLRPAIVNSSAETLISWKRWPYADTQKLSTIEDMKKQLDLFSELMDSDYYVRGSGENSSDNEDEFDARVELSSDHSGNESPTRESVLAPAVIAVKGKKRASISGNPTAKKARRTSMKGPLKRGSPEYEGQAERPKRAHSRASIIELSSDDGED